MEETGIVISKNATATELATAMVRIIEDGQLRKRFSEDAVSWSRQFDWEQSYREFRSSIMSPSV
jgi:glycosyltransferase involved in cell wall biosynthesis